MLERYEGFYAGGGRLVRAAEAAYRGVACRWTDGGLEVRFRRSGALLEAAVSFLALPADWQPFGRLILDVAFPSSGKQRGDVTVAVVIVGVRCRLIGSCRVRPGAAARLNLDLRELPLTAGIYPLYEPGGIRIAAVWPTADRETDVCAVLDATASGMDVDDDQLARSGYYRRGGAGARTLVLRRLELRPRRSPPRSCVDAFGQRMAATWPGKVTAVSQMRRHISKEAAALAAMPLPAQRDEYGGWTGGPVFAATGFFRVDRDAAGRWWFVDPRGYPFWSFGATCVRPGEVTPVRGREFLFEALPDPDGPEGKGSADGLHSPFRWNLRRKWSGDLDAWRARVIERFRRWGLNTVANWSEEPMLAQRAIPHVRCLSTRGAGAPAAAGRFADVFDPRWEPWFDAQVAEAAVPERGNPWLIGYFVDNEAHWQSMDLLEAPEEAALRDAWVSFARSRAGGIAAFNALFGTSFRDWAGVRGMRAAAVPGIGPGRRILQAFEVEYAETYFSAVRRVLRKHDPDHLYLGCRFLRAMPRKEIVRAAGRHCDVVSTNCYSLYPEPETYRRWHDASGRPLLIGEHHLPGLSPRQIPPVYRAFTPAQRHAYYVEFVEKWAAQPYALGCHWFQFADQPLTGRASNGECDSIGFVDITDQPHEELVRAARVAASRIYEWHSRSRRKNRTEGRWDT